MKKLILLLFIPLVFACSSDSSDDNIDDTNPVYLDTNGVTIKARDWAVVGESGTINGITYTIVNRETLDNMIDNQEDLTRICTSKIIDMSYLFWGCNVDFNQPIGNWDVSNVTDMSRMFGGDGEPFLSETHCELQHMVSFNQDISLWDVSNVTNMRSMFANAKNFNQDISSWDVSNVEDMSGMFEGGSYYDIDNNIWVLTHSFNQPLNNWYVSSVTTMQGMFYQSTFNKPIDNWDVSSVETMHAMFAGSLFNQPIGNWDVGNVNDMSWMLHNTSYNQDLSNWDVNNVINCANFCPRGWFSDNNIDWALYPNFTNCGFFPCDG